MSINIKKLTISTGYQGGTPNPNHDWKLSHTISGYGDEGGMNVCQFKYLSKGKKFWIVDYDPHPRSFQKIFWEIHHLSEFKPKVLGGKEEVEEIIWCSGSPFLLPTIRDLVKARNIAIGTTSGTQFSHMYTDELVVDFNMISAFAPGASAYPRKMETWEDIQREIEKRWFDFFKVDIEIK